MALLRHKNLFYQLGFALYFIAFIVFVCSLVVPGTWIYFLGQNNHSDVQGRNVWSVRFPACLSGHGYNRSYWRCGFLDDTYALEEKTVAVVLMALGTMMQLAACCLIALHNKRGLAQPNVSTFQAEVAAGIAVSLSYAGLIIYIRFTYFAVNVRYGPGLFLHFGACALSFVGLFLTGLFQLYPLPRPHASNAG